MKTARPVPKGDELTELISSKLPSHLFNVANQSGKSEGKSKRESAPTASSRNGSNGTVSKPSLPKHWNKTSVSNKPASSGASNINLKSLVQQHHLQRIRRAGSVDSFETGSSASSWSDSYDDSTTYDSVSIGSESCASYASSVSDIIWGQVVRRPAASSELNPLAMGGSGNKTNTNRVLLHSKLKWNLKTMLGILALLALSGSLVYLATFSNYQSMFQISKQQHDNTASQTNNEKEGEGRDSQLRLTYRKLPNGGSIVQMVPDLPVLDKEKETTTSKKEAIPILKQEKRKGKE